jgi:sporulation related protein
VSYQQIHSDQREDIFIEPQEPDTRPHYRGILVAIAALLLIGAIAGGVWFAYQQGLRHASVATAAGDVPLIRADERPTRVKPENPGGMEIPDRDKLIYTQKRAAVEHLLPPAEKPMLRPTAPQSPAVQHVLQPPPAPDGPDAGAAAPVNAPPAQPQQPAAKSAGKNPPPVSSRSATQETRAHSTGARLQLGSVRSEEAARNEWDRVRRANSDLLGDLSATPVRADLGDRGVYYRIQTGPTAEADRICAELRHRNIGCIIAR